MSRPSESGFTLVEVLVALAITGIAVIASVGSVSRSAAGIERYRDENMIAFLAQAVEAKVSAEGLEGDREGIFDTHPDYSWRIEVEDVEYMGFHLDRLAEVRITIISPQRERRFTTFVTRTGDS